MTGCFAASDDPEQGLEGSLGVAEAALTSTLFSEGFEGGTLGNWTASSGAITNSASTGYANHSGTHGGRYNGIGSLTKTLSTVGYTNITVSYWVNGFGLESTDKFLVEWSTNGSTWTAAEAQFTPLMTTSFPTAPSTYQHTNVLAAGAAGQAALQVRFKTVSQDSSDGSYLDDVTITGDSGAAPACGDAVCNGTETCSTCPGDCGACAPSCGDLTCNGTETCSTCPGDCGACAPSCGDHTCNGTETCSTCPGDCGACAPSCGDLACNGTETCSTCPGDCGACSSTNDPTVNGPYAACYYTANLSKPQFASPRMYYPCAPGTAPSGAIASGVFAASTLTPGYTNNSSVIFWLADHAATHGFIVLAVQPDGSTWGNNPDWRDAHIDAYAEIVEEAARAGSPIQGHVNTNKIQIMGFSKGGGGALMAAQSLTQQGKVIGSVQALAPYYDTWSAVNAITAPTAIHCGSSDTTAPVGSHGQPMYNGLSTSTKRMLGVYTGLTHGDWYSGTGTIRYKMKQYITSWMKVYLDGNSAYQPYLNGANHQASWFTSYTYVP